MKTRSGRTYCGTPAMPRRKKAARKTPTRAIAPTIANIERRIVERAQEKKRFELTLSTVVMKRTFVQKLVGDDILKGSASSSRSGDTITLSRVYIKYLLTNNVVQPAGLSYGAPIKFYMFIVQTTRSELPNTFWYQAFNSDSNVSFGTDPLTAAGDTSRILRKINKREIKILAQKVITVGPRSPADSNMCAVRSGTLSTKKLNIKMHYNTEANTGAFTPQEVRPNIWVCYYALQPDITANDAACELRTDIAFNYYFRE